MFVIPLDQETIHDTTVWSCGLTSLETGSSLLHVG
jgi:hypothetical protein